MRKHKASRRGSRTKEARELIHALKTHQVDAIVGQRHVMLVRLKQVEQNLQSSRDQLRALAANLLSVRENERTVIARELHDEFGKALTHLHLGLSWISRKLAPEQQPLQEKIRSLSATTTSLIQSVRNIASELRPGVLDELGLVKTLRSEAREFEGHTGIPCRFKTNTVNIQVERPVAVAVFRIVQAALTNVIRHAQASRVLITLVKRKRFLVLMMADNGKGIPRELIHSHNSLGITGMRERTLALGGTFALRGSRGKGTRLVIRIPLSRATIGTAG
jgi:signal transduction histidine kinase